MDRSNNNTPIALLVNATLALAVSALLLLSVLAVYVEYGQRGATAPAEPLAIPGKKMQMVYGSGEFVGETLEVTGYHANDNELMAIAVRRGQFSADDFPLLRYGVDTGFPGPKVDLIWRLASDPVTVKSMSLSDTGDGSAWLNLARNPDWHGTVLEIGVYVIASNPQEQLSIAHLTLEPRSWWGVLCSYWADWTTYRGWSVRSINTLFGTADYAALSPVVVAAAWSALAVTVLLITGLFSTGVRRGALVAVVLLPWISLDMLWQHELDGQLARTRNQFAGKTEVEKHLADVDGPIYRYVQRLKQEVLPEKVARIVILHDSHEHNFDRLKTQYYLLPHNSFNFGKVPPEQGMDSVDYVLVLGDVPAIQYHAPTKSLIWRHGKKVLPVELVDSDPLGRLFRVIPAASQGTGKRKK